MPSWLSKVLPGAKASAKPDLQTVERPRMVQPKPALSAADVADDSLNEPAPTTRGFVLRSNDWTSKEIRTSAELGLDLDKLRVADAQMDNLPESLRHLVLTLYSKEDSSVVVMTTKALLDAQRPALETYLLLQKEKRRGEVTSIRVAESVITFARQRLDSRSDTTGRETAKNLQLFFEVVVEAVKQGASDIHWCIRGEECSVLFRVQGDIIKAPLDRTATDALLQLGAAWGRADKGSNTGSTLNFKDFQRAMVPCFVEVDDRVVGVKMRMQTGAADGGEEAVMRLLVQSGLERTKAAPSLVETLRGNQIDGDANETGLGYLPEQAKLIDMVSRQANGSIILSGPTGSGKTTTIYNTLLYVATPDKKCATLEDPVEGKIYGVSQFQVTEQPDETADQAYARAFKAMMRMDPDALLISEIRGPETAGVYQQAVETGHFAMTTVHAYSALGVYERLSSDQIGVPLSVLANNEFLSLVVHQLLLQRLCDHCKLPGADHLSIDMLHNLEKLVGLDGIYVRNPEGCPACQGPGKRPGLAGRTACAEVLLPDDELLDLVRRNEVLQAKHLLRSRWLGDKDLRVALRDASMDGKGTMEVAIWKMCQGMIDPREVEKNHQKFELYRRKLGERR